KIAGRRSRVQIDAIEYQLDINELQELPAQELPLNGIGRVTLTFAEPQILDSYQQSRDTGSFIFIDRLSNITVGAGLVWQPLQERADQQVFSAFELELNQLIRRHFPHWGARDLLQEGARHE
ncbi:MAG: elongation factor 1-alpha C-terminal domain-related protein, partial [Enterobacteriaceae bacterium]